jgi:hypothetical protein
LDKNCLRMRFNSASLGVALAAANNADIRWKI